MSQIAAHAAYGGVVPEIAARAHVEVLDQLIARALEKSGVKAGELDGVAAAAGPGLIGGVLVGLSAAKGVARRGGQAVPGGQPSGSARADPAHRRARSTFPICCCSPRAAIRRSSRSRASANMCGSARRWTTPSARPSTRRPSCSASAIPAARRWRRRRARATWSASPCPARCWAGRTPISRSPASRRRCGTRRWRPRP